ncbi:hypothetical protein BDY21DRAFT_372766 [Lineolata rhizophorae]|uniref:rRNA-processing protein FYV7 n=1 Tax=Lineolata rhizophorae TaxID=578093 RepID=A0A6A6NWR8_9PEZI|nr:hypothetical protein BDY21DRAFT_372766 [Lineolata rhizophorae]
MTAAKHPRDDAAPGDGGPPATRVPDAPRRAKKQKRAAAPRKRKGFSVGPAHLPDGPYRRKARKIKRGLVEKARAKRDYAKLKRRERDGRDGRRDQPAADADADAASAPPVHPSRRALLSPASRSSPAQGPRRGRAAPRRTADPFAAERARGAARRDEAEERRREREGAARERERRREERARARRAMAGARREGAKLGRESGVLLERVRRMVAEEGGG